MQRPLLIGIGEILWDMLPAGRQLGGAPANFAYHAHTLGGLGAVISRVGDDTLGGEILMRLDDLRVDRKFVGVDPSHPTGTVEVRVDVQGMPDYVICRDVAWDYLHTSPGMLDLARRADGVCFGSLGQRSEESRNTIQALVRATGDACLRIFDINLRQNYFSREFIEELLALANVLKLNDQELPVVAGLLGIAGDDGTVARTLVERYSLRALALTRGSAGSSIYSGNGAAVHQPVIPVDVVDTVGAGDAFTATMALGMLAKMPWAEIGERAARVAAYVCTQHGATPAMPDRLRILPVSGIE